jgi:acetyltransferase-like isoleucine patch superfamily enzyme
MIAKGSYDHLERWAASGRRGVDRTPIAPLLYQFYAAPRCSVRDMILRIAARLEGGEMMSQTLRRIFKDYHQIEVGLYSYGGCFNAKRIAPFTQIGRYCSFAEGVVVLNANHPLQFKSTHPFFYNPRLGCVREELIERRSITIGNDVWVGCNAIILPAVSRVGDGAVIGAGAIVTRDVPDFAVVAGNPARIIRYRFSEECRRQIKASRWWDKSIEELRENFADFTRPFGPHLEDECRKN